MEKAKNQPTKMVATRPSAQRLAAAVAQADDKLAVHRRNRVMFLKQFAGHYYTAGASASGSADPAAPQSLNMVFLMTSVLVPNLIYHEPRSMISTPQSSLRGQAELFALAWNHLAREIDLKRTLRTVVTDAMFGAGIIKTGLCGGAYVEGLDEPSGYLHDNGQPFADAVDLDDYIIDPHARTREHATFEGNRYRLPLDYVLASGLYQRSLAERLVPTHRWGDSANPTAADISASSPAGSGDSLAQYVELIDLWLPNENVVVTIGAGEAAPQGFLREVQWDGPERGPYEMLGFHWVPNNVMPIPPVSVLFDMHVMINAMSDKLAHQADRQKDLLLYDRRDAEEAEAIEGAADGDMIGVDNVDRYSQVSFGGANPRGYEHLAFLFEQFNRIGGNTDLLGGLGPQSDTLGQDSMLMTNASIRVDDMRSQVYELVQRVGEKLAWYLWTDPLIELPLVKRSASGEQTSVTFSAADREGDFLDYNFDIEPYSMAADSPNQRYHRTMEWVEKVILPTAKLAAEQGKTLNVKRLAEITGRLLNIKEVDELFVPIVPTAEGA